MKIDILTLAALAMPMVPSHMKPLAEAVVEEVKNTRAANKHKDEQIADLTRHVTQAHGRIDALAIHVTKLSHMALVNANGAAN